MRTLLPMTIVSGLALIASMSEAQGLGGGGGLQSNDLFKFRSVGAVQLSPDGRTVAYTVTMRDRPGRPYSQLWVMDLSTQKATRFGDANSAAGDPHWSPDGAWVAYSGSDSTRAGVFIAHPDGSGATFLAPVRHSNVPLPAQGQGVSWSPDGKQIAFVSAMPGPETANATGDPMVITRYLYRPTASEGFSHFNDNRRLHLFIVDVTTKQVRQLTSGLRDEHSIDWSPDGKEILFVSNYDANADEYFNYDVFAITVADGKIRRLTATESAEYAPRWSPDGKRIVYSGTSRGLTDRETTMEDTHVWMMNADGSNRRDIGAVVDARQGFPQWSSDGSAVYFTVQQRGSTHLVRMPVSAAGVTGQPQIVVNDLGAVGSWAAGRAGQVVYTLATIGDLPELYARSGSAEGTARKLTDLNADVLRGRQLAAVDSFTFVSNDNRFDVQAFLVKPVGLVERSGDTAALPRHPLIVEIHGGPHGQNGPAFSFQDQVYAAHGWAVLHVNYRGSTGYGQKFVDAILRDADGDEGQDVLYGVNAAVRRYLWIDRERMGIEGVSYGGQLTDWLITQTNEFKAAIPTAGISNLISFNYIAYYNQFLEMEFGQFLHQGTMLDEAWKRSALRYVAQVHTPTMLMHGENDPDVPISEAEQFYVALKDVGVEAEFVRYPREGHGLSETGHQVDGIDRRMDWYERHFPAAGSTGVTNVQP
jgi:dipeptidyl aminopeptidase/acylaminoacyl peptidase